MFLLFFEHSGLLSIIIEKFRNKECPKDVEMVECNTNEYTIEEGNLIKDNKIEKVKLPEDIEQTIKESCCVYNKQFGDRISTCVICHPNHDDIDVESGHSHMMYHAVIKFHHKDHCEDEEHHHHNVIIGKSVPVFMMIILSIHSIMEGLSLGAINNESSVISTFIVIAVHKIFESFAMGSLCKESGITAKSVLAGFITFSLMPPLGAIVASLIKSSITETNTGIWLSVVFQGIAAGSFLYVGLLEIISHELHSKQGNPLLKILSIFLGTCAMGVLGYWV